MRTAILFAAVLLGGCTLSPTANEITDEYVDGRRAMHADFSRAGEAWMCRGMSVYEWRRVYHTPERAAAWQVLCSGTDADLVPEL